MLDLEQVRGRRRPACRLIASRSGEGAQVVGHAHARVGLAEQHAGCSRAPSRSPPSRRSRMRCSQLARFGSRRRRLAHRQVGQRAMRLPVTSMRSSVGCRFARSPRGGSRAIAPPWPRSRAAFAAACCLRQAACARARAACRGGARRRRLRARRRPVRPPRQAAATAAGGRRNRRAVAGARAMPPRRRAALRAGPTACVAASVAGALRAGASRWRPRAAWRGAWRGAARGRRRRCSGAARRPRRGGGGGGAHGAACGALDDLRA